MRKRAVRVEEQDKLRDGVEGVPTGFPCVVPHFSSPCPEHHVKVSQLSAGCILRVVVIRQVETESL